MWKSKSLAAPLVYMEIGAKFKMGEANGLVDWEVDILNPNDGVACGKLVKTEDLDATECSSSFGDTLSESEDMVRPPEISDIEVDSPFCPYPPNGDAAALMEAAASNGLDRLFKKKKVSAHWRKFISPLMWRCQWLELRMKELQSQVSKYDRELAVLKHEKELQSKIIELDCSSSRSVPFSSQCCRKNAMKRRRRKRNEETTDASSYILNHVVFSYYEKAEADGHSVDDNGDLADDNTKGNDDVDWLLGIKAGDSTVEQILSTIQYVQDRVLNLRSHLKKATAKKTKGTSLKVNTLTSAARSSSCSPGKNKDAGVPEISPRKVSDCDMEDAAMPDSALSSYGEANDMDIFESTMSLLSADVPHQMGELCQSSEDVLIDNQAAEEGYQNFKVVSHPGKRLEVSVKKETGPHSEEESTAPTVVKHEATQEEEEDATAGMQRAALKPCYTGKRRGRKPKKRRRGGSSAAALSTWKSERIRKKKQL